MTAAVKEPLESIWMDLAAGILQVGTLSKNSPDSTGIAPLFAMLSRHSLLLRTEDCRATLTISMSEPLSGKRAAQLLIRKQIGRELQSEHFWTIKKTASGEFIRNRLTAAPMSSILKDLVRLLLDNSDEAFVENIFNHM